MQKLNIDQSEANRAFNVLSHEMDELHKELWESIRRLNSEEFDSVNDQLKLLDHAKSVADDWRSVRTARDAIMRRHRRESGEEE